MEDPVYNVTCWIDVKSINNKVISMAMTIASTTMVTPSTPQLLRSLWHWSLSMRVLGTSLPTLTLTCPRPSLTSTLTPPHPPTFTTSMIVSPQAPPCSNLSHVYLWVLMLPPFSLLHYSSIKMSWLLLSSTAFFDSSSSFAFVPLQSQHSNSISQSIESNYHYFSSSHLDQGFHSGFIENRCIFDVFSSLLDYLPSLSSFSDHFSHTIS